MNASAKVDFMIMVHHPHDVDSSTYTTTTDPVSLIPLPHGFTHRCPRLFPDTSRE